MLVIPARQISVANEITASQSRDLRENEEVPALACSKVVSNIKVARPG
jgi:hypothetical protein